MSRVEAEYLLSDTSLEETDNRVTASLEERIDASPGWAFALLSAVYFVVVFTMSSVKLLWLDELITLHIAGLDGPAAIWHALSIGADPNPPVTHLLVHYSRILFGDHEFAYRLPVMLGYWVGLISLYSYMRSRVSTLWALGATVLSMCMAGFEYSYESRSYGIFYGLAMLAFFSWSCRADELRTSITRTLALAAMVFALALGISTNYFAVLAFFPVGAGEVVRTRMRMRAAAGEASAVGARTLLRSVDAPVWLGMAVAATPLIAFRPLILHSIAQFAPYAWNKVSLDQAADSYTEMVEATLYPLLALFAAAVVVWLRRRRAAIAAVRVHNRAANWPIPAQEAVGVFFFMLYPFLGFAIASIKGGMLSPRFVVPVCYGFAIAGAVVAMRLFGNMRRAGIVFLALFTAWFVCREAVIGYWYTEQKQSFYSLVNALPEALRQLPPDAPLVMPDPLLALSFHHYAPAALATRVAFPVDFPAVRAYRGDDSPEENLWAGRGLLYDLRIETLADFKGHSNIFLIVAGSRNWLLWDLAAHRYRIQPLAIDTGAGSIGGFTPLAHGVPRFYVTSWTAPTQNAETPIPFHAAREVPSARGMDLP